MGRGSIFYRRAYQRPAFALRPLRQGTLKNRAPVIIASENPQRFNIRPLQHNSNKTPQRSLRVESCLSSPRHVHHRAIFERRTHRGRYPEADRRSCPRSMRSSKRSSREVEREPWPARFPSRRSFRPGMRHRRRDHPRAYCRALRRMKLMHSLSYVRSSSNLGPKEAAAFRVAMCERPAF